MVNSSVSAFAFFFIHCCSLLILSCLLLFCSGNTQTKKNSVIKWQYFPAILIPSFVQQSACSLFYRFEISLPCVCVCVLEIWICKLCCDKRWRRQVERFFIDSIAIACWHSKWQSKYTLPDQLCVLRFLFHISAYQFVSSHIFMNGVRQLLACRLPLLSVRPTLPRVFIRATRNLPSIVSANEYYFCFFFC